MTKAKTLIQELSEQEILGEATNTAERIKHIASVGLRQPEKLTVDEVRELCGSVMAHITRHGPLKR